MIGSYESMFGLQILYAAVTLAGYSANFAPQLFSVLRQGEPSEDGSCAGSRGGSVERSQNLAPVSEADTQGPEPSPSTLLKNPSDSGVRLRRRKGEQAGDRDSSNQQGGEDVSMEGEAEVLGGRGAHGGPLLDPHVLWLCGSFTLQVHRSNSCCSLIVVNSTCPGNFKCIDV